MVYAAKYLNAIFTDLFSFYLFFFYILCLLDLFLFMYL